MLEQNKTISASIESMDVVNEGYTGFDDDSFEKSSRVPSMVLSWHDIIVTSKSERNKSARHNNKSKAKIYSDEIDLEKFLEPKRILDNVYGVARPGEVIAIVGPSGAGKTSLLNVLTQRNCAYVDVKGSVKVNGIRVNRSFMKKICAYVQQDDLFIGSLTVQEHLQFMARLKMGRTHSVEEQNKRVKQVMHDLGLSESANSIIGTRTRKGLSGGEKKRLAFASEVLTSPPILICDEPTSGLDAFLAFQVISVLKKLAKNNGMTILLTIHQPSSQVFQLFDSIYIMVDGRVAFCGSQSEAESLWAGLEIGVPLNFNPCDHYLSTLSQDRKNDEKKQKSQSNMICDAFQSSESGKSIWKESTGRYNTETSSESSSEDWRKTCNSWNENKFHASFFQQIMALTWRASKTVIREPTLLKVQLMQSVIIALLTGLIYTNNNPINQIKIMNINGSLYQMISNMAFMFQFSVVHHFCLEIETFYRESESGLYRISAYFLSKNLAELPSYTISAVIFTSILYWMSGLVAVIDSFLIYMLTGFLVQNIAISIGYFFTCVFGTINLAVAIMPIFVVPMMAFGGFFINQDTLPIFFMPLKYISYFGYGYEAVAIGQWSHVEEIPGCSSSMKSCLRNGTDVLDSLSFKTSHLWTDILIMFVMIFIFRFMAFLALLIRSKRRR